MELSVSTSQKYRSRKSFVENKSVKLAFKWRGRMISLNRIKHSDLMIYDQSSERHVVPLLGKQDYIVFDPTLTNINLWAALSSLRFGRPSLRSYLAAYATLARIKIIISTIDNSPALFQIKTHKPNISVVVVQNGRRDTIAKFPGRSFVAELSNQNHKHRNAVDFYFVFGQCEVEQFAPLIDCKFVQHGSLKNNYLKLTPSLEEPVVSFISGLPNDAHLLLEQTDRVIGFDGVVPIYMNDYYEAEFLVAEWVHRYCVSQNLNFQIIGKRNSTFTAQEEMYRRRIAGNWAFRPSDYEYSSYDALIGSKYVAGVDSTLLLEMFGLGKRTAFFTIRGAMPGVPRLRCADFGYPLFPDQSGPMWTNQPSEPEFRRVMDFVVSSSDDEWRSTVMEYSPFVMAHDPGNATIATILKSLGVTIEESQSRRSESAHLTYAKSTL